MFAFICVYLCSSAAKNVSVLSEAKNIHNQTRDTCTPSAAQKPAIKGDVPDKTNGGCFINCVTQSVNATAMPTPNGIAILGVT